jgi:NADPH:quinone reductase-like Zn-dependent oxidoreductase
VKAIALNRYGGPEVLEQADLPTPKIGPDGVLVRARTVGINPVDWKMREGRLDAAFPSHFPLVPGWDVAGVVQAVGPAVTAFAVGDEVLGYVRRDDVQHGTYAELVPAPERTLTIKPAGLGWVEAAALPLAGLTAYQVLKAVHVGKGDTVLVHAAAGGVGHLAVQVAKARGAYVLGTARAAKHDFLRSIGVDEPIDYTTTDFTTAAKDVDVVVDMIGGEYGGRSLRVLRPGGLLVAVTGAGPATLLMAEKAEVRAAQLLVEPDHTGLEGLAELVAAGSLRPRVDTVLPLEEAARAHELGESGRTAGKIVLSLVS